MPWRVALSIVQRTPAAPERWVVQQTLTGKGKNKLIP
jgi:hypothetical protein